MRRFAYGLAGRLKSALLQPAQRVGGASRSLHHSCPQRSQRHHHAMTERRRRRIVNPRDSATGRRRGERRIVVPAGRRPVLTMLCAAVVGVAFAKIVTSLIELYLDR